MRGRATPGNRAGVLALAPLDERKLYPPSEDKMLSRDAKHPGQTQRKWKDVTDLFFQYDDTMRIIELIRNDQNLIEPQRKLMKLASQQGGE